MAKTKKEPLPPKALEASEMADSTREQQEAHVRVVKRSCAGRLMYKHDDEQAGFELWRKLVAKGDEKGVRELIAALIVKAQKVAAPGVKISVPEIAKGDWDNLKRAALPLIRLRGSRVGFPCRADHNDLIVAEKFDGADHVVECPGCGTEVDFKSPVF